MEVTPTVQYFQAVHRRIFQREKLLKLIMGVVKAENAYFRSENRRWRQTKGMNSELYNAAQTGQWDVMSNYADQFCTQQTANRGTVLHVLAECCNSSDAAQKILETEPHLLLAINEHNETALHLAANKGHSDVVRALIDDAKRSKIVWRYVALLTRTDVNGNSVLHKAVGNNRSQVVKLLVEENPEFEYQVNVAGESPLYIAVENAYHDIVDLILSTCKSPSYEGPGENTALHAAVIQNSPEYVEQILEKLPHLTKKVDKIGWTALHYAAKYSHQEVVKLLLSKDKFIADIAALKDDSKTALHVAITHGHLDVIKEILSCVPDCWEGITSKRQNIFHLVVQHEHGEVVEFILNNPRAVALINHKDVDRNTPLHLYVAAKELRVNNLVKLSGVDMNPFNNIGLTPLGMIPENEEVTDRQRTIRDELKQAGAILRIRNVTTIIKDKPSTGNELKHAAGAVTNVTPIQSQDQPVSINEAAKEYTVVAALIVTVTFAACFTVPGGYDNQGKAVLPKNGNFTLFVVTDLLAMLLSIFAILLRFLLICTKTPSDGIAMFRSAQVCIGTAMLLMVVAFLSGLAAVLPVKPTTEERRFINGGAIIIGCLEIALFIIALVLVCKLKFGADRFISKKCLK